ncbi:multidrug transporter subunit MdtG, partial [Enterococcus lactis]
GISASALGYRPNIFIKGIILFFVFLLSLFFVHEKFVPVKKENIVSAKQIFKVLKFPHVVIRMFVTPMFIQASHNSISP